MVSIIIRTKNEVQMIGRVLEQVFNQDFGDIEVIIVDSGSEDATLTIARQYPARIVPIPPERFTFGYALNVGAQAAQGECLVALSGHAVPANSHWLSELLKPPQKSTHSGCFEQTDSPSWPTSGNLSRFLADDLWSAPSDAHGLSLSIQQRLFCLPSQPLAALPVR